MIGLQINVNDQASPAIRGFLTRLQDRRGLNLLVGQRAQNVIRDHLIQAANSRHDTARRLGATPSGFLTKAAEKVGRAEAVQPNNDGVTISLNHPGLRRAFGDVTIRAGTQTPGAKFLTIPLVAEAYNQRARRIPGLFPIGRVLAKKNADGSITPYYALVPSVVQKQDRSLLPSDAQITRAALAAVRDYVKLLRSQQSRGAS